MKSPDSGLLQIGKYFSLKGGIETVTQSLVNNLRDRYVVDVLCFSQNSTFHKNKVGASTVWQAATLFNLLSSPISFNFFRLFKRLRNNYDIVFIHYPNPLAAIALFLFNTKGKVVVQWHGDILNKGLFYIFYQTFERMMLDRADLVLATSDVYKEHSPALSRVKNKCKTLPLGINEHNLQSNCKLVNEIRNRYNNKNIVFALGRYVHFKGFEYLIEAGKYLDDNVVILIGGYGPKKQSYIGQINKLGLQKKVYLIPELNDSTWGSYFEACDVFCPPSIEKSESFGIVLLEAMSFSKPIVTTNIPGSATSLVNQNGVSGLNVSIKNSKEIAEAIKKIVFSDQYKNYCKNARKRFDENFKEEKMIAKLIQLLQELQLN